MDWVKVWERRRKCAVKRGSDWMRLGGKTETSPGPAQVCVLKYGKRIWDGTMRGQSTWSTLGTQMCSLCLGNKARCRMALKWEVMAWAMAGSELSLDMRHASDS